MKTSTPRDAVQLSPNAVTVLEKRYLVKDDSGKPVETPSDLFWRVARTIAEADRKYGATEKEAEQAATRVCERAVAGNETAAAPASPAADC